MIKFRGFPRPVYDETFTSWISRCGHNKYIQMSSLLDIMVRSDVIRGRFVYEDPDFDLKSTYFLSASSLIDIEVAQLESAFSPKSNWLLPWHRRKYYCPDCLFDDVRNGRNPSWRKSWCYAFSSHCQFHRKQLIEFPGQLSSDKAWDAFVDYVNFKNTFPGMYSKWSSVIPVRLRYLLQLKTLRLAGISPSPHCNLGKNKRVFASLKVLAQIFLQARTMTTIAGVARHLFDSGINPINRDINGYPEALEMGSLETNSHERMCGVILSGFILSFFNKREMEVIRKIYSNTGYHFPEDKYRLGQMAFDLSLREDYLYIKSLFCDFPSSILKKVKKFIDGIDSANSWRFF